MSEFKRITVVNHGVFVVVDQMDKQHNQELKFGWTKYTNVKKVKDIWSDCHFDFQKDGI